MTFGSTGMMHDPIFLDNACTATRMLEKKRQLFEAEESLEAHKNEFARKEDAFHRREEALRKRDLKLQESLIQFNKFLQENENKRTRAMKRFAEERKQIQLKEEEADQLNLTLQDKINEQKEFAKKLKKNKKYSDFLTDVVDFVQCTSDDFSEIQDILNRYKILRDTFQYLTEEHQKNATESEKKRTQHLKFIKNSSNSMLNHNNEIAVLQKELETCSLRTLRKKNLVEIGMRNLGDKTSELGQLFTSIDNILEQFDLGAKQWKSKPNAKQQREASSNQALPTKNIKITESRGQEAMNNLERIAEYVIDYSEIIANYRSSK